MPRSSSFRQAIEVALNVLQHRGRIRVARGVKVVAFFEFKGPNGRVSATGEY